MTNDEIQDYDLSTTGTLVELTGTASHERYGVLVAATAAVDFEIEVDGGTVSGITFATEPAVDRVDARFDAPEAVDIRVKNTSTTAAGETADAILGSGGRG
jgi:hypothetical protein